MSHHERWDGSRYPDGLSGEDIPLVGRIIALGDVYDAMTSKRCYKDAMSHEESKPIIVDGRCKHFDVDVVTAFLEVENQFVDTRLRRQDSEESAAEEASEVVTSIPILA